MQTSEDRITDLFTATDANGNIYDIREWTTFTHIVGLGDRDQWIEGLKSYALSDGAPVNRIGENDFETVHPRIKLTRQQD